MSPPHISPVEWIVCERTSRWASAMRMALAAGGVPYRLRELRHLSELDADLVARPTALAAIEIHRDNFAELLAWLPTVRERRRHARCIALLDGSLADDLDEVRDALVEAGAQAVATSPRRLAAVIVFGARHAETAEIVGENAPLVAQVWASLPWQAG
jgi:hypothetical protein